MSDAKEWGNPIETVKEPTGLILIRVDDAIPRYYVAYRVDGDWFLPFDSARDSEGTPMLDEDEVPDRWMDFLPTEKD